MAARSLRHLKQKSVSRGGASSTLSNSPLQPHTLDADLSFALSGHAGHGGSGHRLAGGSSTGFDDDLNWILPPARPLNFRRKMPGYRSNYATIYAAPEMDGGPQKPVTKHGTKSDVMVLNNPLADVSDPSYFYWLYGHLEFRMHDNEDDIFYKATRQIDRLVDQLKRTKGKGHLLFDIVATRQHIETGNPNRLGVRLHEFVDSKYAKDVSTVFIGITDNTARRVARDVFCKCTELSKQKYDFSLVDNIHMFVVYPPHKEGETYVSDERPGSEGLKKLVPQRQPSVHEIRKPPKLTGF